MIEGISLKYAQKFFTESTESTSGVDLVKSLEHTSYSSDVTKLYNHFTKSTEEVCSVTDLQFITDNVGNGEKHSVFAIAKKGNVVKYFEVKALVLFPILEEISEKEFVSEVSSNPKLKLVSLK